MAFFQKFYIICKLVCNHLSLLKNDYMLVSFRDFARMKGVSDTAIHKMVRSGRLTEAAIDRTKPKRPRLILEVANNEFITNTNYNQQRTTKSGQPNYVRLDATAPAPAPVKGYASLRDPEKAARFAKLIGAEDIEPSGKVHLPENAEIDFDVNSDPVDIYQAKMQEAIFKAIKIRLEVLKTRGDLVDKEEVNMELAGLGGRLRNALLAIPDQIVADVYASVDKFQARETMYAAIEAVLLKFSELEV